MTDKASLASYAAVASNFIFGLTLEELSFVVGMVFALVTAATNLYYKRCEKKRRDREESRSHQLHEIELRKAKANEQ